MCEQGLVHTNDFIQAFSLQSKQSVNLFINLQVNGTDMTNATRPDALSALMSSGDVCTMVVTREEVLIDPSLEEPQPIRRQRLSTTGSRRRPSKSASSDRVILINLSMIGF